MSAELQRRFEQLNRAVDRLREALAESNVSSLIIDGTIQRFEFTFELYWKMMKRLLAYEGIEVQTPRETLQQAYQAGWLSDETAWLDMLRDRNQTSHTYNEELARQIYGRIKFHFPEFERTLPTLARRLSPTSS
ncbi:MAG TPA: nucleotidyltransferase substrate binding protein [Candidatus Acidoferrales bacterium]|nr:nucleotidyltransferase substrate binding protein [Candidatus Acidoferrales bacterium]